MMYWGGEPWGWAGWLLMVGSMLAFWGLIAWVVASVVRSGSRSESSKSVEPERILAERFARGEIDDDEYQRRLGVLRGPRRSGDP